MTKKEEINVYPCRDCGGVVVNWEKNGVKGSEHIAGSIYKAIDTQSRQSVLEEAKEKIEEATGMDDYGESGGERMREQVLAILTELGRKDGK